MDTSICHTDWFITRLGDLGKAILDSSPEGIIIANKQGDILYVNSSYTKICFRKGDERVGQNIFATNNNGALAETLQTGKPVFRKKFKSPGSMVDVVSNAFPIYLDHEMVGGVAFFQEAGEAIQLLKDLEQKEKTIQALNNKLESIRKAEHSFDSLIGGSPSLLRALSLARKSANSDSTVLLRGESGTGKDLFAEAIHNASHRSRYPMIKVNCAAIPNNLLESEFFGHEKGAFTGAHKRKPGTFELADKGTIFLDEIGDMELQLQAKLLQVLHNGEFRRVGGTEAIITDTRVIAATNRDLEGLISEGSFREDLYYRLNVVRIDIPPLRDRKDDIPVLVKALLIKLTRKLGRQIKGLTIDALDALESYDWPGNVRELENVLERAINFVEDGAEITAEEIYLPLNKKLRNDATIQSLDEWDKIMIERALKEFGTSFEGKSKAAKALGISITTLYNKIKNTVHFDQLHPYRYSKSENTIKK